MRAALAALGCAAVLAGCDGSSDQGGPRRQPEEGSKRAPQASDERVIEGWIRALNAGDYARAASFFAPGAVVEQAGELRLPDRAAAIAFNKGLPCRADVTDVEDEGRTTLAAFRLREGRGPRVSCHGAARVRFTIRRGRFTEWRQLPESAAPPSERA